MCAIPDCSKPTLCRGTSIEAVQDMLRNVEVDIGINDQAAGKHVAQPVKSEMLGRKLQTPPRMHVLASRFSRICILTSH